MGAITGTLVKGTELAGSYKIVQVRATVASASDTITLTQADHGITAITGVMGYVIESGAGANFQQITITSSDLTLTLTSTNAAGAAASSFGNVLITVIGTQ